MKYLLALVLLVLTLSAHARTPKERIFNSRIYNLTTGEVINSVSRTDRQGHSVITAGPTKSGENFNGEATSIQNGTQTTTRGSGTISTPGVTFDSYVRSSSYSVSQPGYQNGSAILVGDQGTIIDAVYRVNLTGTGEGEARDNKGVNYRIVFSQQAP